jgi:hypothetical protein
MPPQRRIQRVRRTDCPRVPAEHGYVCIPVNDKKIQFPDGGYKDVLFDRPAQSEGFTGLTITTAMSGIVVIDIDNGSDKDRWAGLLQAGITP